MTLGVLTPQQNATPQSDTRRDGSSTILMNVTLMLADVVLLSVIQLNVVAPIGDPSNIPYN